MTSISSLNSSQYYQNQQNSLFSKLDSDQDGKVTKDEFVNGRPKDVSADKATALFDKIDSEQSGSISESQLETAMSNKRHAMGPMGQVSSGAAGVLMQMQPGGGAQSAGGTGGEAPGDDSGGNDGDSDDTQVFDALDTNKDGVVSADELLAAKPDNVSAQQADNLYKVMDLDGQGGISATEFSAFQDAMKSVMPHGGGRPPMGPPPGDANAGNATDASLALDLLTSETDTTQSV